MLKHLDYLMINNGGCDPFHYLKGKGGLGYKPSPPFMHGLGYDYNLIDGGGFTSYKNNFNSSHGLPKDESHTLEEISKLSGFKKDGLQTIYDKGMGAYYSNHQSVRPQVKSPEQWAMARVYAAINPTSGAYKVDKSHLRKHMKGGMAGIDPDDPEKIFLGTQRYTDSDNNTKDINDEIIDKIEDLVSRDDEKVNKKVLDFIANELLEMQDIGNENNHEAIEKYRTEYNRILDEMNVSKDDIKDLMEKKNKKNYMHEIDGVKEELDVKNSLYDKAKEASSSDIERGDVTEDLIKNQPKILSKIDGDDSKVFNSKELKAKYYNPEFLKVLKEIYKKKQPTDSFDKWVFEEYLKFFPVDFLKKNTLWEIKSHKENNKNYQDYAKSKIEGYNNPNDGVKYDILFIKNRANPNKKMIRNIFFTHNNKSVKVLKDNNAGYNYLTLFNNEEKRSYYNPMIDNYSKNQKGIESGIKYTDLITDEEIQILKSLNLVHNNGIAKKDFNDVELRNELINNGYEEFEIPQAMQDFKNKWMSLREQNNYGKGKTKVGKFKYKPYPPENIGETITKIKLPKKKFMTYSDNLMRRDKNI